MSGSLRRWRARWVTPEGADPDQNDEPAEHQQRADAEAHRSRLRVASAGMDGSRGSELVMTASKQIHSNRAPRRVNACLRSMFQVVRCAVHSGA